MFTETIGMRFTFLINALNRLRTKENKVLALWEQSMPFSLDELEAKLITLSTETVKDTAVSYAIEPGSETFDELLAQLEHMWELMEDLDDCSVV
jgi:hypothetical protein